MDRFIRTNGIQLHYLERPGDEPSIVLLPGLTANAHAFDGCGHSPYIEKPGDFLALLTEHLARSAA